MRRSTAEDYRLLARHIRGLPLDPPTHYREWESWSRFLRGEENH